MARKDKLSALIRDEWPTKLDEAFEKRFWVKISTEYCLTEGPTGAFVSTRHDEQPLTPEQLGFIHGYMQALAHVYVWNGRV